MREERQQRRQRQGNARLRVQEAERSGELVQKPKILLAHSEVSRRCASLLVGRGDKIGVVGLNGSGKTTLLHMLLGQHRSAAAFGTNPITDCALDQLRAQLNLHESVAENIAPGQEYLDINGQRRHVYGYLQDFYSRQRARERPWAHSQAASETDSSWRASLPNRPISWSWTNRPTTSMPKP